MKTVRLHQIILPTLLDFPEELLPAIVKYLYSKRNTLLSLAVVCKRFAPLARILLVKRAFINVPKTKAAGRCLSQNFTGFRHFLKKYPELVDCLDWLDMSYTRKRLPKAFDEILQIVAKSQSLTRLSFCLGSQAQFSKVPILFHPPPGCFTTLQEIDIDVNDSHHMCAEYLVELCELPNLRTLRNSLANVTARCSQAMLEMLEARLKTTCLPLQHLESMGTDHTHRSGQTFASGISIHGDAALVPP